MPRLKQLGFNFTVFVVFFTQACIAIDLRNSNTDIFNITSVKYCKGDLNDTIKEYVTRAPTACPTRKKWQVGRVSRKQYEIINMLWRKTNIFADEENSLSETKCTVQPSNMQVKPDHLTAIPELNSRGAIFGFNPVVRPSTISSIEFYYLDENIDPSTITPETNLRENRISENEIKSKALDRLGKFNNFMSRSPLFSFQVDRESVHKRMVPNLQPITLINNIVNEPEIKITPKNLFLDNFFTKNKKSRSEKPNPWTTETNITTTPKPNDRVKFFEMYDSNTRIVNEKTTDTLRKNEISGNEKLVLEKVDKEVGHGPNQNRNSKKHVKTRDMAQNFTQYVKSLIKLNKQVDINVKPLQSINTEQETFTATPTWDDIFNYTANVQISVAWTKYPFTAIYVYERYQVHCDAAAISPYWLVTSAACISRHREDPAGDRSAFVAYCGESWWDPERIAYVKYTLIHPRYHPKDIVRKHLYNIGAIQVASSMASSCPGWEPVTIMSHQYVTDKRGSMGSAVGWGLNRYDTTYASRDLPRHRLSVYENFIYSNNCPGNSGYRNTKRLSELAVSNVYCLALPNYYGEDSDPVHGGMLLVGGKLIALYLQEERRRWGDQSAQYTGVWRLIPWVNEVAKDPDDTEFTL